MSQEMQPLQRQNIRLAATVVLMRDTASGPEVFMLQRPGGGDFPDLHDFPGGKVDDQDLLEEQVRGCTEAAANRLLGLQAGGLRYWVTAIRECFEEAGLLLAYRQDGALLDYADPEEHARIDAYRTPLHAGELTLLEICQRENLRLALDHIHFVTRVVTPPGRPRRFDTRFFMAEAPAGQTGRHDGHETVDSVWISPDAALTRHADDNFGLMSVTHRQLQDLSEHGSKGAALESAAARETFTVSRPRHFRVPRSCYRVR